MTTDNVDNVTEAMAKTNISDNNAEKGNDASANDAGAEGRRLYVGNLAYATTEEELKAFFKDFSVENVSIPNNPRTGRPVGYAFVDLTNQAEVEKAISELSGQEVLERKVSVQHARKNDGSDDKGEGAEGGSGGEGERRRFGGRGRGRGRGRFRGGRGFRGSRQQRDGEEGGHENHDAPTNVPGQVIPLTEGPNDSKDNDGNAANDGQPRRPRVFRERRQRGPPEDGIVSKTKVMVANLPYDYSEEKLKELFAAYEPGLAKIALRPIPRFMVRKLQARNEPRKGRGFGFITLSSEEMQQKAIKEMNGKEVEGREIAVKVAIDSPGKEDDDGNASGATGNQQSEEQGDKQQNENAAPEQTATAA